MGIGKAALQWAKEVNDRKFIDLALRMDPRGLLAGAAENCNACGAGAAAATIAAAKHLGKLTDELDRFLAGEYGISPDRFPKNKLSEYEAAFSQWRKNHRPFHWFADFYGILKIGGFDAIIGNPPYVEYSKVKGTYTIQGYRTESCGNLYAFMWERCLKIAGKRTRLGMIQPVASVCTGGYDALQRLLRESGSPTVSNFNDRPSKEP